jgi:hypothetical protein
MLRPIIATALMLATPLFGQTPVSIYTPEIHIGSATTPSTITVPPVLEISGELAAPRVSEAPPASTELLATRHFDFVVSPVQGIQFSPRGSISDHSISLGEYARQLRAERKQSHRAPKIIIPH